MKVSMLVTVHIDEDAQSTVFSDGTRVTANGIMGDVNATLRKHFAENPYALRDKEHVKVTIEATDAPPRHIDNPVPARSA